MSDFDRGKYHGKKKFQTLKDSATGFGRNYYGRRSPSNGGSSSTSTFSRFEKDSSREPQSKIESSPKIKQPTILIKAREQTEEPAPSPKKSQKDAETATANAVSTTSSEVSDPTTPIVKPMTKSVKFLDDSMIFSEKIQGYLQENSDFLVVGIIGNQGVGKSTIANLLAHNDITDYLEKGVFKNKKIEEEQYGDTFSKLCDDLDDIRISSLHKVRCEIFRVEDTEDMESNTCATHGIDFFVNHTNRTIILDCQPLASLSILEDIVQSESKRPGLFQEYIVGLENTGEIQALQLTAFLMSVCHVLIVVQDWFFDSNLIRFIQSAEMLKPTHSNPEDEFSEHFPHLLMVHNRAQMEDFVPRKFKAMQKAYNLLFEKSKLQKDSYLGLATSKLINCLDKDTCGEPFNLFLIPEHHPFAEATYLGYPSLEQLVWRLKANLLGVPKNPLTHIQLTEKTWLAYCLKAWENVRKSSFFVEYTKLMAI